MTLATVRALDLRVGDRIVVDTRPWTVVAVFTMDSLVALEIVNLATLGTRPGAPDGDVRVFNLLEPVEAELGPQPAHR